MSYNLTGISNNTESVVDFVVNINNELMFGWMGVLLLIGITTVLFMAFMYSTNDVRKSLSASMFIAFGMSIFLGALGLIPPLALFVTLIGSALAIAFTWKSG